MIIVASTNFHNKFEHLAWQGPLHTCHVKVRYCNWTKNIRSYSLNLWTVSFSWPIFTCQYFSILLPCNLFLRLKWKVWILSKRSLNTVEMVLTMVTVITDLVSTFVLHWLPKFRYYCRWQLILIMLMMEAHGLQFLISQI